MVTSTPSALWLRIARRDSTRQPSFGNAGTSLWRRPANLIETGVNGIGEHGPEYLGPDRETTPGQHPAGPARFSHRISEISPRLLKTP